MQAGAVSCSDSVKGAARLSGFAAFFDQKRGYAKAYAFFFYGSLSRVGVNVFLRHRNDVSVPLYVRARKIRFLKFLKFRYPKAFRLITLMALFVPSVKPFV